MLRQTNQQPITAFYPRLSHEDELQGESNSISNQKKYLEDYARRNGFGNIRHFTDDGFSGVNFNRPGFQAVIKEVEAGNVATIIVKDIPQRGKVIVALCAVHSVIDSDKADTFLWENHFRVNSHFQVISP